MRRNPYNTVAGRWIRSVLLGVSFAVGLGGLAWGGEKMILDTDTPEKVALPDAATRREAARGGAGFDFLDRKSSVSGVGALPEIPHTMMPRSKKQLELLDKQKNFLLDRSGDTASKMMTAEEAAGVRGDTFGADEGSAGGRNSFERYISGAESETGMSGKKKSDPRMDFLSAGDSFGLDASRSQLGGGLAQFGFSRDKKKDNGPQIDQPDLFGGTLTASPFGLSKTQKEKDKAQKARDDFRRLLNPHAETHAADLAALKNSKGDASSIEPLAAFGSDPTRREVTPTTPLSSFGARGVEELSQRTENLLAPFQQANRGKSSISFGTFDATGSRFLNLNSSPSLAPSLSQPGLTPRPGMLDFPSRKF